MEGIIQNIIERNYRMNRLEIFSKELNLTGNPHTDSAMAYKQIKRQIKYY